MAFSEGLKVYASQGKVQPYCAVGEFFLRHHDEAGDFTGPKMEEVIRREYSHEIADKIVGKELHDRFFDDPYIWDETSDPIDVDAGFFIFSEELDWETGKLKATAIDGYGDTFELFFYDQAEHLGTSLPRASYNAEMSGLKFDFSEIELLLPSAVLQQSFSFTTSAITRQANVGRPARWDWEGAMVYVITQAQTPDGLPTGHGAQARIEEMIAGWFLEETGDAPSPSQVRQRAANIMRTLEAPKTPKT